MDFLLGNPFSSPVGQRIGESLALARPPAPPLPLPRAPPGGACLRARPPARRTPYLREAAGPALAVGHRGRRPVRGELRCD